MAQNRSKNSVHPPHEQEGLAQEMSRNTTYFMLSTPILLVQQHGADWMCLETHGKGGNTFDLL